MDIATALSGAMAAGNLSEVKVASVLEVSQASIKFYLKGLRKPGADIYQRMRDLIPGFAERIDEQNALMRAAG